jgi:hypothetical protein
LFARQVGSAERDLSLNAINLGLWILPCIVGRATVVLLFIIVTNIIINTFLTVFLIDLAVLQFHIHALQGPFLALSVHGYGNRGATAQSTE